MNEDRSTHENAGRTEPAESEIFPGGVGPPAPEPFSPVRPSLPRPLLLVALFYIAGLTLGRLVLLPPMLPVLGALGIAVIALMALIRSRRLDVRDPASGVTLLVALSLLGWSASNATVREERRADRYAETFHEAEFFRIAGRASRVDRIADEGIRIRVTKPLIQSAGGPSSGQPFPMDIELVFFAEEEGADAAEDRAAIVRALRDLPGARIAAWARPPTLDPASHPWDFDQEEYHRRQGVGAGFHLPALSLIEIREPPAVPRRILNRVLGGGRESLRRLLRQEVSPDAASIAQAMVLGQRSALSRETRLSFRNSGLAHILVVSGLHTAFVLTLALFLVRAIGLPPWAWALCGYVALVAFTLWVGLRPPVVRASIMGAFLLGAWWLGRPASTLAGLAAAGFVTLLIDPRNLTRPDWQLSYACVLSLTLLMPPVAQLADAVLGAEGGADPDPGPLQNLKYLLRRWVVLPGAAVLAILMGLLPFQAHYFGLVNLGTIVSNLLAIPLAYLTMIATLLFAALHNVPGVGPAAAALVDIATGGLLACARGFADPAFGRFELPSLSPLLMLVYGVVLLAGPHLRRGRAALDRLDGRQLYHVALRVGLFLLLLAWSPLLTRAAAPEALELVVLDVGQGDAIVLRAPDGTVGLIDGGGGREGGEGEDTIVPYLRGLGVRRLAFVAATHADADHVGGLDAVIQAFDVPLILLGSHRAETAAWRELMEAVDEHRVRIREIRAGDSLAGLRNVDVHFLGPFAGQTGNNASLVMLIDHEEVEILLTGDIERSAEYRLLEENEVTDIDVLKVAHHGSATSTSAAFLQAFEPELALISAGRNNRFGHPAPEVVQRLRNHGVAVARTDLHGSLRLRSDGKRIRLDSFGPALRN